MTDLRAPDDVLGRLLASGGVKAAGAYLVRTYADDVYGLCRAIVRDRVVAEDLAHDAFASALVALPGYRGEASARTWLLTIARHRCFDHLRRHKRERALVFDEPSAIEAHPEDAPLPVDRLSTEQSLRRALDALDEGDRALVVLRHAHAMGYDELAEVFGVREGTIRMRLSRATARMREALDDTRDAMAGSAAIASALPARRAPPVASSPAPAPYVHPPASYGAPAPAFVPPSDGPPAPAPPSWYARLRGAFSGSAPTAPPSPSPAFAPPTPALPPALPREVFSETLHMRLEALVAAL